jgi:hypothetical protein
MPSCDYCPPKPLSPLQIPTQTPPHISYSQAFSIPQTPIPASKRTLPSPPSVPHLPRYWWFVFAVHFLSCPREWLILESLISLISFSTATVSSWYAYFAIDLAVLGITEQALQTLRITPAVTCSIRNYCFTQAMSWISALSRYIVSSFWSALHSALDNAFDRIPAPPNSFSLASTTVALASSPLKSAPSTIDTVLSALDRALCTLDQCPEAQESGAQVRHSSDPFIAPDTLFYTVVFILAGLILFFGWQFLSIRHAAINSFDRSPSVGESLVNLFVVLFTLGPILGGLVLVIGFLAFSLVIFVVYLVVSDLIGSGLALLSILIILLLVFISCQPWAFCGVGVSRPGARKMPSRGKVHSPCALVDCS